MDDLFVDAGSAQHAQSVASLSLEEPDTTAGLDFDATPNDVLLRIEDCIAYVLEQLAQGRLPTIQLQVARARRRAAEDYGEDTEEAPGRVHTRSLVHRQAEGSYAFVRVFKILEVVHELVREGREATQRDIYYRLLCPPIFRTPRDVNEAIQDAVALLRIPRQLLGISCCSRGAVVGRLQIQEAPGREWLSCASQRAIPGNCNAIARFHYQTDASYIVVVEKDAIFQCLVEDSFCDLIPSILVTAKGMPDMATRAFLASLHEAFPALTVVGLVDWNPSGVTILGVYKHGSGRMQLESARYTIPSLRWLGVRFEMLTDVEDEVWQPLTSRDRTLIAGLRAGPLGSNEDWMAELDIMEQGNGKAEIEALYNVAGFAGLTNVLCQALDMQAFI